MSIMWIVFLIITGGILTKKYDAMDAIVGGVESAIYPFLTWLKENIIHQIYKAPHIVLYEEGAAIRKTVAFEGCVWDFNKGIWRSDMLIWHKDWREALFVEQEKAEAMLEALTSDS